jgi:hypothetical protein
MPRKLLSRLSLMRLVISETENSLSIVLNIIKRRIQFYKGVGNRNIL